MHKWLEDYVKDYPFRAEPGTNPYSQQSHAMAQEIIDNGLVHVSEMWGIEVPLYVEGLYAGTTDACGIYKSKPAIIDYKQTNKPKKTEYIEDYFLQLCAYGLAHNETYGTDIQQGVILMAVAPKQLPDNTFAKPEFQTWTVEGKEWETWTNKWLERVEQYYRLS
jgi:genome maintenance exonuclease 1